MWELYYGCPLQLTPSMENAFLDGGINEKIYMHTPLGFEGDICNQVHKLRKTLYGLTQYPKAWLGRFAKVIKDSKHEQNQGNHTFFIKHSSVGELTALLMYVDDILVTRNDEIERHKLKEILIREFEIKKLGSWSASSVLRWYILYKGSSHHNKSMWLIYWQRRLDKPVSIPVDQSHKLGEVKEKTVVDKIMY